MNILAWAVLLWFIFGFLYYLCREYHASFIENCINVFKLLLFVFILVVLISMVTWAVTHVTNSAQSTSTYAPTRLVCNGVTVAESVDGFSLIHRSGIYVDGIGNISYTPKGGETCKEVKKERIIHDR